MFAGRRREPHNLSDWLPPLARQIYHEATTAQPLLLGVHVASSSRRNEANDVGDTDATLVEGKTSWPDRWIRQTDFEAGIIYGILFPGETSRSRIMRKIFLSFLGKIGQVLEVLINPGEARVGSEVSGLGKNFPSMVSIIHRRQKSTSPPNL